MQEQLPEQLPDEAIDSLAALSDGQLGADSIRRFCEVLPDIIYSVGLMAREVKDLRARLGIHIETPE